MIQPQFMYILSECYWIAIVKFEYPTILYSRTFNKETLGKLYDSKRNIRTLNKKNV